MTSGIHHITAITSKVQANVDFYVGFLGLRLVKRTGGFEDAEQLHLFYGDSRGSPGSLISFLVWEDGSRGRAGSGQVSEFALAIAPDSIGFWIGRALEFGVQIEGPRREFGETLLRLRDPDGIVVKLVGVALETRAQPSEAQGIPARDAIRRIRGATLLSSVPEQTASFIETHFSFQRGTASGAEQRLLSESGDVIDIREAAGFWPAAPGTGVVDHVAFRAADRESLEETEKRLASLNSSLTTSHDRKYFQSLYVREPGGTLLEMATDGPGMTMDEPLEFLGHEAFCAAWRRGAGRRSRGHAASVRVALGGSRSLPGPAFRPPLQHARRPRRHRSGPTTRLGRQRDRPDAAGPPARSPSYPSGRAR